MDSNELIVPKHERFDGFLFVDSPRGEHADSGIKSLNYFPFNRAINFVSELS